MKRKRHTEEQIIAILKEHEAGKKTADLCRKHGISEASFYNWSPAQTAHGLLRALLRHRWRPGILWD
jgi:transposase-like protein